ncbi:MAG: S8 family serine peptidase [Planctomycetes bacterium]|nr:S8 family serine peptidase [Planctomycetota bacterium]
MRRRNAFVFLVFAFFTSAIVVFGTPKRDFLHLEVPPNEIIVKFKSAAAITLQEKTSAGFATKHLEFPGSLNKLNNKFGLRNIKPLFKNFKVHRERLKALPKKDKALLTKREKRVLQRLRRAPEKATVPALGRIYKLQFALAPNESIQDVLAAYINDPSIEYAELNYIVSICKLPDDPLFPLQWPLDNTGQDYPASGRYNLPPGTPDSDIDVPQAWDIHTGSSEVIVAVADTGVDYNHRDLQANIWINSGEIPDNGVDDDGNQYIDDIYGYDFINNDSDPIDDNGHGTHVSGTIAAGGNNGLDIAGVCWNAKIMALKFLNSNGEGFTSDAATAIYYAAEIGADVISNSWGGPYPSQTLQEAIDYAHSQGVIMVAAAGNGNTDSAHYPAFYENMIAVAATDSDDKRAPFSNYGNYVDIAAPGVDVLSLRAAQTSIGTIYDDYTTIASGTSMACPHVAGIIALIISNYPDAYTHVITARLFETTDDISTENPGFDGLLGTGRVNAYKAVRDGFQGIVTLDSDFYSCDDTVSIEVLDFDLIEKGTQPITVTTDGGDSETATVFEDTNKPWLFTGTIRTSSDAVIAEDGTLQLSHGQIFTATYVDGDDGTGNSAAVTATATTDCESPEILNVQIDVPGPEPTVTFQTNEPTTARVLCGLACGGPYIIEATSSVLAASHTIKLTGVSPKTDYFFIIEAADAVGNKTVDDNTGGCFAFTTDEGPRDIYVPSEYLTIQEAIKRCWNGGTVWVADGIYKGQGNRDIDFLGRAIIVRSENGPENCIIDCQGSKYDPHRGFYFHNGEGASSILDGFTITNGYVNEEGGGIYCTGSSPTLINCMFNGNSAQYWGGAIGNRNSSSTLTNCTFSANSAYWGGAVACNYCYQGPTLVNCTFSGNSANHGGAMYNDHSRPTVTDSNFSANSARFGGGVYNFRGIYDLSFSSPKLYNCTFSKNSASSYGGGMFNFESSPTVTSCEFTDNSARHYGGGMYNSQGSNPTLGNCTFSTNSADHGGAVFCLIRSRTVLTNCTITGNSAQFNGGGLFGCLGRISNCTITDNDANVGGGLYGCNGAITNCNISSNTAGSRGGALYSCQGPIISCTIADNSAGALDHCFGPIINCIIWSGDPDNSPGDPVLSVSSVPLYSCVQGDSDGMGSISRDPCFTDAQNGDYHLLQNSPCKDTGNYYYCMNIPCTDLDGANRMVGGQLDMGCYEAGGTPDTDGDWLTAIQESLYGTHPNLPDTDGDGLADGLEILGGTDPLAADPPRVWHVPTDSVTIQQALFFSRPGETIVLAEGTYYENIYLGGRNIILKGTDPNDPNVVAATIINGDTDSNPETISGRVINLAGNEDTTCHLYGMTITHGSTNATGGGIYGAGSHAGISNCIINNNKALDGGGGLYDCDGSVNNCNVTGNSANDGGGLYYCDGPINNCTITANMADYRGGAMFDCGGGDICYSPQDCIFTIANCIISGNSADSGAGMYNSLTNPALTKCTFSGNTAREYGGGMYNYQSSPTITNCIFTGNSANYGGGIYNYERAGPMLTNCTFAENSAPNGNGLACDSPDQQYPGYFLLANCILWDAGDEIWNNDNSVIMITYSNIRGGWADKGNIDADPLFADTDNGDYRLLAASPCIDAAIDAGVYEDIDGNIRPFDFPGVDSNDETLNFDMGAYEAVATMQSGLFILPRTINRGRVGEKILAVMRLPEPIVKDDIDAHVPLVLYPGAVKATEQYLIPPGREAKSNVIIHAVFNKAELVASLVRFAEQSSGDNGDVELTVVGRFGTGEYFYGTDTVRVISPADDQGP